LISNKIFDIKYGLKSRMKSGLQRNPSSRMPHGKLWGEETKIKKQ